MAQFSLYWPLENGLEGTAYENVPGDQPTKFGLIADDLTEFYGMPCDATDVKNLTSVEASAILKKLYWDFF